MGLMDTLMSGHRAPMHEVVSLRALLGAAGSEMHRPLDLGADIRAARMEVGAAGACCTGACIGMASWKHEVVSE